jgi:hypothetical protein
MGSNLVINKTDEILSSDNALILIKSLFNATFSVIKLEEIVDKGVFYYGVKYIFNDIEIWFGCEKAYLNATISINKQYYSMNKWIGFTDDIRLLYATEKNIYLLFDIVKNTVHSVIYGKQYGRYS